MRACLFGTYNRDHSANRIVANVLRARGYRILEVHEPLWEHTRDKDARYFSPLGLARLAPAWLGAAWRLTRKWIRSGGAPLVVVGFNGQLDLLLLRMIARRAGLHVVFAPLVSITETLIDDRGVYSEGSLAARLLAALDRCACRLADTVVVDSEEHARYFVERLGVARTKLHVAHLGVDSGGFPVAAPAALSATVSDGEPTHAHSGAVEVIYFGQYLPLHGVEVIADAVERLASRKDIRFVFIGTGEARAAAEARVQSSDANAEFIDWVAYHELAARIARADIALGIFGSSAKARMVVPNKVYQAAAAGCAIVTADTPALREVFAAGTHIEVCAADGAALAAAIAALAGDPLRRAALGNAAARLMAERFNDDALADAWRPAFAPAEQLPAPCALVRALEAERAGRGREDKPCVGIAILNYGDAGATLACVDSLRSDPELDADILVVDNPSTDADRQRLEQGLLERPGVRLLELDSNTGYAGGNNRAMDTLFADGADYVLLLNDDTLVERGAVAALVNAARADAGAGLVGPRVLRDRLDGPVASVGERVIASLAWMPRTLIRYRMPRQRPYRVSGVIGCALLIRRDAFEKIGPLDESFFAYYEEIDYCLRAPSASLTPVVAPAARVAHRGRRGFAGGMTTTVAYLKARNLALLGERRTVGLGRLLFAVGYIALLSIGALGYLLRGRADVAAAMFAGAAAAARNQTGPPPHPVVRAGAARVGKAP